jgi:hypothetical protein
MANDSVREKCTSGARVQFGGSESEPTATLTRLQAIRAFRQCHPEATVEETIQDLCSRGLLVDEEMIAHALS